MSRGQIYRGDEFTEHEPYDFVLKRNSKCTHLRLKVLLVVKTCIKYQSIIQRVRILFIPVLNSSVS